MFRRPGGGSTVDLTAISGHVTPDTTGTYNVGSSLKSFNAAWLNSVRGTTDLFLGINGTDVVEVTASGVDVTGTLSVGGSAVLTSASAPTAYDNLWFGANTTGAVGVTNFAIPYRSDVNVTTTNEVRNWSVLWSYDAVITFGCIFASGGGAGTGDPGVIATLRIDGVDTATTLNLPLSGVMSRSSVLNQAIAAGNRLSLKVVTQAGLSSQYEGLRVAFRIRPA